MTEDQLHLSQFCRICNEALPKYSCPRCKFRTCSLSCYKKHKSWAQCSGERDPTKFVQRSQLATPAGIDHDFNFLTGIERSIDRKEKSIRDRGLSLAKTLDQPVDPPQGSNLHKAIVQSNITIHRAPMGLVRQKANKTRWHSKHKCIQWTVEWIHADGTTELQQCLERYSVSNAYNVLMKQNGSKKRKLEDQGGSLPSQRPAKGVGATDIRFENTLTTIADDVSAASTTLGSAESQCPLSHDADRSRAAIISTAHPQTPDRIESTPKSLAESQDVASEKPESTLRQKIDDDQLVQGGEVSNNREHSRHFYLQKPKTVGQSKVLILLDPAASLTDSLKNRELLEFPSVLVLEHSPETLPQPYILENEYLKERQTPVEDVTETSRQVDFEGPEDSCNQRIVEDNPSEERYLSSLSKDLKMDGVFQ